MSSCINQDLITWEIPLHNSQSLLEIELPCELGYLKKSVHLSDCKSCGRFQTILSNKEFNQIIEDTTGFFTPWLMVQGKKTIFYIEEELYPLPDSIRGKTVNKEDLDYMVRALYAEDPRTKIVKCKIVNNIALVKYETVNMKGVLNSRNIDGLTYVDNQIIIIHFIQNNNFQEDLSDDVWTGIQNLKLIKN